MQGSIGKKYISVAQENAEFAEVGISRVWTPRSVLCELCGLL